MRKLRKCVTALLALCLLAALACVPAMADSEGYKYTVTLSTGGIDGAYLTGTVSGNYDNVSVSGDTMTITGVEPGSELNFTNAVATTSDCKYEVHGITESGHDYDEAEMSWIINEDTDFVVAYHVAGQLVTYTVSYVDANGNALAAQEEFQATLGAKPVVAYKYIEGYEPQAYNITWTLTDEDGDGVSDRNPVFTYTEVVTEVVENVQYETVTVTPTPAPSAAPGEENAEGEAAEGEEAAEAEEAEEGEEVAETEETTEGEEAAAEEEEQTGPVELEDLDDEEVPLAESPTSEESDSGSNMGAVVGGIAAVVVIAGVVCGVVIKKRKVKT